MTTTRRTAVFGGLVTLLGSMLPSSTAQGDDLCEMMLTDTQYFADVFRGAGIDDVIENIGITCVDSNYPAEMLDSKYKGVTYDEHHVQQVGKGWTQVFLAKNIGTNFLEPVHKFAVNNSLSTGVIQVAYNASTQSLVIGIPGDTYAFDTNGNGFGFNNPDVAPAHVARYFLEKVVEYSTVPSAEMHIDVMGHPDCGLYANNVGDEDATVRPLAEILCSEGRFEESAYARREYADKKKAFDAFKTFAEDKLGVGSVFGWNVDYQQRAPSVCNALAVSTRQH